MDPVTAVIIAAATAGVTEVGKKSFTDAYQALKNKIADKFGPEQGILPVVAQIEKNPDLAFRHQELAYEISEAKADSDQELIQLVEELKMALEASLNNQQQTAKNQFTNCQIGVAGPNAKVEGGIHFGKSQ